MKAHKVFQARKTIVIISGILVLTVGSVLVFRAMSNQSSESVPYIPQSISSGLLFEPYTPSWLPDGYKVDAASYSAEGQALVFSAVKSDAESITISEQTTPKDVNTFLTSNITDAKRLDGASHASVFGKMNGRNLNVISATIDSTWILVTGPESVKSEDAKRIVNGLVQQ